MRVLPDLLQGNQIRRSGADGPDGCHWACLFQKEPVWGRRGLEPERRLCHTLEGRSSMMLGDILVVKQSFWFLILSFEKKKKQDADALKVGVADLINQWVRGGEHGSRCSSPFKPAVSPSLTWIVQKCILCVFVFYLRVLSCFWSLFSFGFITSSIRIIRLLPLLQPHASSSSSAAVVELCPLAATAALQLKY